MSTKNSSENPRHPKEFPVFPGIPVISHDGETLGEVVAVQPAHFQVDADGSNYWLAKTSLAEANESSAVLSFDAGDLELYRMDEPVAQAASPVLDAASDAFDDEADLNRTRAEMEAGHGDPVARNAGR